MCECVSEGERKGSRIILKDVEAELQERSCLGSVTPRFGGEEPTSQEQQHPSQQIPLPEAYFKLQDSQHVHLLV